MNTGGSIIGASSLFFGCMVAKTMQLMVACYLRSPFSRLSVKTDTLVFAGGWRSSTPHDLTIVSRVFGLRGKTQVFASIVKFVAVDVIWLFAPRKRTPEYAFQDDSCSTARTVVSRTGPLSIGIPVIGDVPKRFSQICIAVVNLHKQIIGKCSLTNKEDLHVCLHY